MLTSFHFLLLFVTFFTSCNFCNLLFIVEGGRGVVKIFFFKLIFNVEGVGGGWSLIFFLFHLTCGRGRGRGLIFFLKTFFSLLNG